MLPDWSPTPQVGASFLYVFLPETKGKSLEEMYAYFESLSGGESLSSPLVGGAADGKVV